MPRLRLCSNSKHVWKPLKGGKHEKCVVCKTLFPCKGKCDHLDCCYVRGDKPPKYYTALLEAMGLGFEKQGLKPWKEPKVDDQVRTEDHGRMGSGEQEEQR